MKQLTEAAKQGKAPSNLFEQVYNVGAGLGDITLAAYRKFVVDPLRPNIPADLALWLVRVATERTKIWLLRGLESNGSNTRSRQSVDPK